MEQSVASIARELETKYISRTPEIMGKYVDFDMYDTLQKIDAYLYSRHISGPVDSLDREKPFFNIVTAGVNVWYRATDIDRKNILIRGTKRDDVVTAFVANILVHEWMRKNNFGSFLNEWGRNLAKYGSAVVKFVEKDGQLYSSVVPWNQLICDSVDFDNNLKIEKLYFTPAQLRANKGYDQKVVEQLIEKSQTIRKTLERQNKDTKTGYIEVYEVHGEIELSQLTGRESDKGNYAQQMWAVSSIENDNKEFDDYVLAKGREKKDPYMLTHLIKEDGRTLGIGAVECLFDAQWMVNHSAKLIKDQLDLASKLIFQTSDPAFVNYNAFEAIETGDILVNNGNPLTQLQNNSHDISNIQNYQNQWVAIAKEISGTPDAIRGNTQPSGTAYRLQALVTAESHSLFDLMIENKGLHIEDMMKQYVLPHVMKEMDTTDEISAILDAHWIDKIDNMFVPAEAQRRVDQRIKEEVLNGNIVSPYQRDVAIQNESQDIQKQLSQLGNQRFIKPSEIPTKTWKSVLKDFVAEVEVEVTDEQRDKEVVLTTLNSLFERVIQKQGQPFTQQEKLLFNKIIAETGVMSPIELKEVDAQSPQSQISQPIQQSVATGGA